MSLRRKNAADGVITFHTPFPLDSLKSREFRGNLKDDTSCMSGSRKILSQQSVKMRSTSQGAKDGNSTSEPSQGPRMDRLSHTSLRRLQAKMEAENDQARAIIHPQLDAENDFVKDLESFLNQWDAAELRKRELLHKRWTDRVWTPMQRRLEERVSSCWHEEAKRRRSLYSHYIQHCNTKGFVFLESYDPQEYDPFLLSVKKPHYFKLSTSALKDPLFLQPHVRAKEKRTAHSRGTGSKYTRRQREELLDDPPHLSHLSHSVAPQADPSLWASRVYPDAAFTEPRLKIETELRKSNRLSAIPYYITATATADGRCHQSGCWSFRR